MSSVPSFSNDYFYHKNHQNSITYISDTTGTAVNTYGYDAFGFQVTGITSDKDFTYTGREYHNLSGLYYYRNRFYSPLLGRFITQDPIGLLGGTNLYAYVGNDPVNLIDPLGLDLLEFGANFGAGMGDALTDPTGVGYSAARLGYSLGAGPGTPEFPDLPSGTELARELAGTDEVVNKCSKAYRGGEYTGYTVGSLLVGGVLARTVGARTDVVHTRGTPGADGGISQILKTKSLISGRTIKVVHQVTIEGGKIVHRDLKMIRFWPF